jgi:dsRNA-specific ribonuclease
METGGGISNRNWSSRESLIDVGQTSDLGRSGQDVLAVECLYAIVGALALQKGGKIAGDFIKERILTYKRPPGSRFPLPAPSTKPAATTSSETTPAATPSSDTTPAATTSSETTPAASS